MAILAGTVLALLAVWLVLEPLLRAAQGRAIEAPAPLFSDSDDEDDPRAARRDRALAALKEIDFDRATGKLSDADYDALKAQFSREALDAMNEQASNAVAPSATSAPSQPSQPSRFCFDCGAALEAGKRFCMECGSPVGALPV